MRPRLFSLGEGPCHARWCGLHESFNEAEAVQPRRGGESEFSNAGLRPASMRPRLFSLGEGTVQGVFRAAMYRFNEAEAVQPRRGPP